MRMMSCSANPGDRRTWLQAARPVFVSAAVLITSGDLASAAGGRNERLVSSAASRVAGEPIMAIVSLRSQQITVYDANGWILRAPISSGQKGRETPAGIFSIIQKEAEHYSNLYDDAFMPHMERITWSGIALHGGALPGHPASHGCVRLPYDFAERLFEVTRLGMRVIVAPGDAAPVSITHPALFTSKPGNGDVAAARAREADKAAMEADQARLAVAMAFRDAARARIPVRAAENLKRRADAQLAAAERALASAGSAEEREQAQDAKAQAAAKAAELEAPLAAANAELQPKLDALAPAREAAAAAETARVAAAEAARQTARDLEPVSVFISRKMQRLYIRQAFQPVLEIPVTIRDADRPIGTHVFTAMERTSNDVDIRWSVVSLNDGHPDIRLAEPYSSASAGERRAGSAEPTSTEPSDAKAALDRITIPKETLDRIAGMVSPRSSLIISDEALSAETGNGTEFVVLISGEPQGGIKSRRRGREIEARYDRPGVRLPYRRSPFADQY
jgi:hypothetical protein